MWMAKGWEIQPDSAHHILLMPVRIRTVLSYPGFKRRRLHASDPSLDVLHSLEDGAAPWAQCIPAEGEVTNLSRPHK